MYNKYYFSRIKLVNKENEAKKGTRIEKLIEIIHATKKNYDHSYKYIQRYYGEEYCVNQKISYLPI